MAAFSTSDSSLQPILSVALRLLSLQIGGQVNCLITSTRAKTFALPRERGKSGCSVVMVMESNCKVAKGHLQVLDTPRNWRSQSSRLVRYVIERDNEKEVEILI